MASRPRRPDDAATSLRAWRDSAGAHDRLPEACVARRPRLGLRSMGWPGTTADALEAVAPGRRAAIWAHDHHALWAATRHCAEAVFRLATRRGGVIRRAPTDRPTACCMRAHPARHDPRPGPRPTSSTALIEGEPGSAALGVVACHDPASSLPTPTSVLVPGLCPPASDAVAYPCASTPACATTRSPQRPARHRSGARSGRNRWRGDGRLQKCFADGSLGSGRAATARGHRARSRPPDCRRAAARRVDDRSGRASRSAPTGRLAGSATHDPRDRRAAIRAA
jgi:predicted amidohydrolase YtcJ